MKLGGDTSRGDCNVEKIDPRGSKADNSAILRRNLVVLVIHRAVTRKYELTESNARASSCLDVGNMQRQSCTRTRIKLNMEERRRAM